MIDIDVARRLHQAGLPWAPTAGDLFAIDNAQMRDEAFMLSSMVIEQGRDRGGQQVFRFNGTTEWALDSVQQHEAVWIPREEQLRAGLGEAFDSLHRESDGSFVVRFASPPGGAGSDEAPAPREVRAPNAEDAYAGALLVHLTGA